MKLLILGILAFSIFSEYSQNEGGIALLLKGLKSEKGMIRVLVFNKAEGFPEDQNKAFKALSFPASDFSSAVVIEDLPAGSYAIALFHDENSDGKMKKNNLGFPLNSYGFSKNPTLYFGPPSFSKCEVSVKNSLEEVEIILR